MFSYYRPVRTRPSEVDEDLFSTPTETHCYEEERKRSQSCVDLSALKRFSNVRFDVDPLDEFTRPPYYPQRHPISSRRPAATALNQSEAARRRAFGPPGARRASFGPQYVDPSLDFIPAPSIPRVHMPHAALKRQVRRGWRGTRPPTNMSVCTARDSFDYDQWMGLL